jgi:hypothetical protein
MINASAQNTPIVVSRDSVLDFAPIAVRNLSEVAVAIHNLRNQLINFGNFTLQFESLLVVHCIFIFFFFCCFLFLLFRFFPVLTAMALEAAAPSTLFAVRVKIFVFNGVRSIVGMVPLPFCCSREFSWHWRRHSDAPFSSFEINA